MVNFNDLVDWAMILAVAFYLVAVVANELFALHRFHRMDIHAPRCLNMGGDIIVKERS